MRNRRKPVICRTAARPQRHRIAIGLAVPILLLFSAVAPAAEDLREQSAKPVFRSPDSRPRHDDANLKELGIASFESKRLKLYTDVPAKKVQSLLSAVDAEYDALVDYFGPLPPNPERTEFQVTGYLMADKALFQRAGLLPEDLAPFLNGRHQGQEFWVNEQETDYYRRHLVIHEVTHCFMFAVPGVHIPSWYMEGMAELFGTHRIDAHGRYEFRVMPDRPERFDGLGRIPLLRTEVAQGRWKSFDDLRKADTGGVPEQHGLRLVVGGLRVSRRASAVLPAFPRAG